MLSDSYDVHNFYTASTDAKGHGTTLRLYLPPTLLYQMGNLVASRKIPQYRSKEDIGRDAIFHRLHFLQNEFDLQEIQLSMWQIRMQLKDEEDRATEALQLLDYVTEKVAKRDSSAVDTIKNVLSTYDLPLRVREQFELLLIRAEMLR